jgi:hypothetical protein
MGALFIGETMAQNEPPFDDLVDDLADMAARRIAQQVNSMLGLEWPTFYDDDMLENRLYRRAWVTLRRSLEDAVTTLVLETTKEAGIDAGEVFRFLHRERS